MAKIVGLVNADRRSKFRVGSDLSPHVATAERTDPLIALASLGEAEEFPAGITLFRQGHRPTVLWFIESGLVKTMRIVGTTEALVSPRGPGWVLGLAAAYLDAAYSSSGLTAIPCVLRAIQPHALRAAMESSPALASTLLKRVLAQGRRDEIHRAEMAVYPARERLALALVRLASVIDAPRRQGHLELALPITNGELAQLVGTSPQHLSRMLASYEASGKLIRRKGVLLLPLERWPVLRLTRSPPRV